MGRNWVWIRHFGAGVWFVIIALLVLGAALAHGTQFGSFDLLHQFGLLRTPGLIAHNIQAGDQSDLLAPWATLSWIQVHHGHLPLWNQYAALGMPLAFNWQAASFSIPSLIGYLAPLDWAFTVQVVVTLVIAGSGVYALGRVLGWSTLACVFAGTVFELSGPMVGWLGWPLASTMSWAGWLFAAAVLILRDGPSARRVTGLALVVASMIYSGHPEGLTLFVAALVLFVLLFVAWRQATSPTPLGVWIPLSGVVAGLVAGAALGAPLLLPGLQVIHRSVHATAGVNPAELVKGNPPLPPGTLIHLVFQGYDGLPVAGNHWFGYAGGYSETAAYLGVIPLVLALLAVARQRHRPEVVALSGVIVAMTLMAFLPPLVHVLGSLPLVGNLVWQRAVLPVVFGLTVLSGVGMNDLMRAPREPAIRRWLAGALGVSLLLMAGMWLFGQGTLPDTEARIRRSSFVWAIIEVTVGVLVVGMLAWVARTDRGSSADRPGVGRWAGIVLLACETAFLVSAGAPLWTASSTPYGSTSSTMALRQAVGSSVVGFGAPLCFFPPGLGIPPNAQVAYGVQELGAYDPLLPDSYYTSWKATTGEPAGSPSLATYCPAIRTVSQARLYGVSFVLEPRGSPGPRGSRLATTIDGEGLFEIPGAASVTFTPRRPNGRPSAASTPIVIPVQRPDPTTWTMVTAASVPGVLHIRLTNLPGWHATVDGHPVSLGPFDGVMLQTDVPAGRHRVELTYWPARFTQGLVLAAVAAIGLVVAWLGPWGRRRKRAHLPEPAATADPGPAPVDLPPARRAT